MWVKYLKGAHPPTNLPVKKTFVSSRNSIFENCEMHFYVKSQDIDSHLYQSSRRDNCKGPSIEDKKFLDIMCKGMCKDSSGHWSAPLPFRTPRPSLPNNRSIAMKRAKVLQSSLRRNPVKCEHFVTFMQSVFDAGHAEKGSVYCR